MKDMKWKGPILITSCIASSLAVVFSAKDIGGIVVLAMLVPVMLGAFLPDDI